MDAFSKCDLLQNEQIEENVSLSFYLFHTRSTVNANHNLPLNVLTGESCSLSEWGCVFPTGCHLDNKGKMGVVVYPSGGCLCGKVCIVLCVLRLLLLLIIVIFICHFICQGGEEWHITGLKIYVNLSFLTASSYKQYQCFCIVVIWKGLGRNYIKNLIMSFKFFEAFPIFWKQFYIQKYPWITDSPVWFEGSYTEI